ncbi:uncharacterized protein GGS25DRAFT_469772 [Hypoxylon fragiforme]|uniref:uncharacterized protein n=1 Tax=Hypoxylon fragiforme TaxID=63214 RepID=UPI0020C64049|nr:uncharacterized protein GGS25DRAFT_469772 [Hypoxylon fragiforme]KAI2613956.1 hypothetical protein GGS25DRAFT_469772 [Hypoxylon fragiforme]
MVYDNLSCPVSRFACSPFHSHRTLDNYCGFPCILQRNKKSKRRNKQKKRINLMETLPRTVAVYPFLSMYITILLFSLQTHRLGMYTKIGIGIRTRTSVVSTVLATNISYSTYVCIGSFSFHTTANQQSHKLPR